MQDKSLVSNVHELNLDTFYTYLKKVYKETRVHGNHFCKT